MYTLGYSCIMGYTSLSNLCDTRTQYDTLNRYTYTIGYTSMSYLSDTYTYIIGYAFTIGYRSISHLLDRCIYVDYCVCV